MVGRTRWMAGRRLGARGCCLRRGAGRGDGCVRRCRVGGRARSRRQPPRKCRSHPALKADVVLARDAREHGRLFAAKPGDPATIGAEGRQSGLLRSDPCPSAGQEFANLGAHVTADIRVLIWPFVQPTDPIAAQGVTMSTTLDSAFRVIRPAGSVEESDNRRAPNEGSATPHEVHLLGRP
jgi:hypothetical protein